MVYGMQPTYEIFVPGLYNIHALIAMTRSIKI
jgi:hypothetical protein